MTVRIICTISGGVLRFYEIRVSWLFLGEWVIDAMSVHNMYIFNFKNFIQQFCRWMVPKTIFGPMNEKCSLCHWVRCNTNVHNNL